MDIYKNIKNVVKLYLEKGNNLDHMLKDIREQLSNDMDQLSRLKDKMDKNRNLRLLGPIMSCLADLDRLISKLEQIDFSKPHDNETSFDNVKETANGFHKLRSI